MEIQNDLTIDNNFLFRMRNLILQYKPCKTKSAVLKPAFIDCKMAI